MRFDPNDIDYDGFWFEASAALFLLAIFVFGMSSLLAWFVWVLGGAIDWSMYFRAVGTSAIFVIAGASLGLLCCIRFGSKE